MKLIKVGQKIASLESVKDVTLSFLAGGNNKSNIYKYCVSITYINGQDSHLTAMGSAEKANELMDQIYNILANE